MVHLNRVATDKDIQEEKCQGHDFHSFKIDGIEEEPDDFTATVYGSKYAAEDLPRHDMPVRACFPRLHVLDTTLTSNRTARCRHKCTWHATRSHTDYLFG